MSLKVQRLRLPSGKKIETQEDYLDFIKQLLSQRPRSPKQLSIALQKSTKQTHRYLKKLLERKEIEKLEGTDNYKIFNSKMSKREVDLNKMIETSGEFMEAETTQRFLEKCTRKNKMVVLGQIQRICLGKKFPSVKIHPDNIIFPDTFEILASEQRKRLGTQKLDWSFRQICRTWISKGMGISLESNKELLAEMGLDGDKDKPKNSRLYMKKEQYDHAKSLLKNDEVNFCKFGFRYWTFCRPSSMYIVEPRDLRFYDRTVSYIELKNGKRITDPDLVQELSEKYKIYTSTKRACSLEIFEHKTQISYTKYIFDQEIVHALEKLCEKRKRTGYKYLFWDNNETVFTFENYDKVVQTTRETDNKIFKEIFLKCGFSRSDFGTNFRANYALRHFGVQWWLQESDYNYGLIADMGWEDITTLKLWYGQMIAVHFEKKIGGVIF